jgi:nitroreductase
MEATDMSLSTSATVRTNLHVTEAIESRRSIRRYTADPISTEEINELLRLTGLAPSAWNLQPWRMAVVTDPQVKTQLQAAAYGQAQVGAAPVVLVLTSDMEDVLAHLDEVSHPCMPAQAQQGLIGTVRGVFDSQSVEDRGQWGLTQANIALGFFLVAATGLGYATSAMLGFDHDQVKAILGLPAHVKIAALVAVGHAAEAGFTHHRHPVSRITSHH